MPSKHAVYFRKNLAHVIEGRQMTIQSLADLCGMHRPNVSRLLSGKENVTIERAEHIAKALKLELPELISKNMQILQESH